MDDLRRLQPAVAEAVIGFAQALAFAAKHCKPGTSIIFPDKRIFRRTEDGMREATPEDIAELAFCDL